MRLSYVVVAWLTCLPGCGQLEDMLNAGLEPQEAKPGELGGHAASEVDITKPLSGQVYGLPFVPRSVIFATGINHAGLEETHIVASSARNYCEHIRDGIEEERSLRVMLRAVRYTGEQAAGHVLPGKYTQVERVHATDDTLGVPAPNQVVVEGGTGNALTAGVARVRSGCRGQRLFAAAVNSVLNIDAHDFTGIRGHIDLQFDPPRAFANPFPDPNVIWEGLHGERAGGLVEDGLDELLPIRLGGTFVATPCPWLGSVLDRDPAAPFAAHQCMGSPN